TKLAVSCFLRFLDLAISVPCPPSNTSICTLNSPEITKLTQRAPKKSSEQVLFWTTWTPNPSTPGDLTAPTY
ncbi:hypothetical protein ILYODFUR_014398, partial [Ilyodon furcidens]